MTVVSFMQAITCGMCGLPSCMGHPTWPSITNRKAA